MIKCVTMQAGTWNDVPTATNIENRREIREFIYFRLWQLHVLSCAMCMCVYDKRKLDRDRTRWNSRPLRLELTISHGKPEGTIKSPIRKRKFFRNLGGWLQPEGRKEVGGFKFMEGCRLCDCRRMRYCGWNIVRGCGTVCKRVQWGRGGNMMSEC
jgi:hypothetical protein